MRAPTSSCFSSSVPVRTGAAMCDCMWRSNARMACTQLVVQVTTICLIVMLHVEGNSAWESVRRQFKSIVLRKCEHLSLDDHVRLFTWKSTSFLRVCASSANGKSVSSAQTRKCSTASSKGPRQRNCQEKAERNCHRKNHGLHTSYILLS